jgi:2'-5' RNA ligase
MYSIISALDSEADSKVKQLRAWLMGQYPTLSETLVLEPHLSWLSVEKMDVTSAGEKLTQKTQTLSPLHLETTGFGLFSGAKPVLYLPVIKTEELAKLHASLWELLTSEAKNSNLMFRPDQWLPHISVFYFDENESAMLGCALGEIAKMEFNLQFTIDHLIIAYFKGDQYGQQSIHRFHG